MRAAVVLCGIGIVLMLPGAVQAVGEPQLVGTVGPGFTIALTDSGGNKVTTLAPGVYDIVVHDLSTLHNFHLTGPGVNKATLVAEEEETTWEDVVLQASSRYDYVCDPHSTDMYGSFTTTGGSPPQPPPPGPPPPGPPPPGPPPPGPPPPPPPPGSPPPAPIRLGITGVKISVLRRGPRRFVVARARINHLATARLALLRRGKTRASARKNWAPGLNRIQAAVPRPVVRGRWTAVLQVGNHRFRRNLRIG